MILLKGVERLVQRRRQGANPGALGLGQFLQVLAQRLARIELPFYPIEARHQHGREGKIGIHGAVGRAEFQAHRRRIALIPGDADAGASFHIKNC